MPEVLGKVCATSFLDLETEREGKGREGKGTWGLFLPFEW